MRLPGPLDKPGLPYIARFMKIGMNFGSTPDEQCPSAGGLINLLEKKGSINKAELFEETKELRTGQEFV